MSQEDKGSVNKSAFDFSDSWDERGRSLSRGLKNQTDTQREAL